MTEAKNTNGEKASSITIENPSRRKAVKTIVAGTGALAAYHTLPVNWSTPIIEQVFLPAHAQTSGVSPGGAISCNILYLGLAEGDHYNLRVTFTVAPAVAGVALEGRVSETTLSGNDEVWVGTETSDGPIVTGADGTWSTDYLTAESADFESVAFTATIISTGESSSCSWHGP